MKIVLSVLVITILLGVVRMSSAVYRVEGHCQRTECEVCGKTIYEWVPESYKYSGDYFYSIGGSGWYCMGEDAELFEWDIKIVLCEECYKKYKDELNLLFEIAYGNWIGSKREEYIEIREKNHRDETERQIREKRKEVDKLYKQILELEDTIVEELSDLTIWATSGIMTTTTLDGSVSGDIGDINGE